MTDQPVREPMPPDPERDRVDDDTAIDADDDRLTRPSKAEGAEEDAGPRPPRPSQAEGERDGA
jgi:hypothetical protein